MTDAKKPSVIEGAPIIEIKEGRFFEAMWFVGNDEGDWFAALWTDGPADDWHFTYRFRYVKDDVCDPYLVSKDEKSVWSGDVPKPVDKKELRKKFDAIALMCAARYGNPLEILDLRTSDTRKILKALQSSRWANMRMSPISRPAS